MIDYTKMSGILFRPPQFLSPPSSNAPHNHLISTVYMLHRSGVGAGPQGLGLELKYCTSAILSFRTFRSVSRDSGATALLHYGALILWNYGIIELRALSLASEQSERENTDEFKRQRRDIGEPPNFSRTTAVELSA